MKNIPQATLPLICQDGPTKTVYSINSMYQGTSGGLVEVSAVWAFEKTYIDIVGENSTSDPGIFFYDYTYNLGKGRIYWNHSTDYFTVTRASGGTALLLGPNDAYFDKRLGVGQANDGTYGLFQAKSSGYVGICATSTGGTIGIFAANDNSDVRYGALSNHDVLFLSNNAVRFTIKASGVVNFANSVGFNGTAAPAKPTVTGSRGGNAALASLLTALAAYGLITDSTTA